MIKNITHEFKKALFNSKSWKNKDVRDFLQQIERHYNHFQIDWDEQAGENWGVIMDDSESVVMISSILPLAFYVEKYSNLLDVEFNCNISLIPVINFDKKILQIDKEIFAEFLCLIYSNFKQNDEIYSVNDLYYLTV